MQRVFIFALMTLSKFRVALFLPLAFGCAHAVYDGQPSSDDEGRDTSELPVSAAGSTDVVNSPPVAETPDAGEASGGKEEVSSGGAPSASAGETGTAGKASGTAGAGKSEGGAGPTATAGAPAGGSGSGGAPTTSGGAATAGSPSGGASAGAPSGGTSAGGSSSAGAPSGGASGNVCSGLPTWSLKTYAAGDRITSGGKVYKCKTGAESGWCGLAEAYAPTSGFAWMDAWILVGPC